MIQQSYFCEPVMWFVCISRAISGAYESCLILIQDIRRQKYLNLLVVLNKILKNRNFAKFSSEMTKPHRLEQVLKSIMSFLELKAKDWPLVTSSYNTPASSTT